MARQLLCLVKEAVHYEMTTFLKTVRQCKSHWTHTMNMIFGEGLLAIKLYLPRAVPASAGTSTSATAKSNNSSN